MNKTFRLALAGTGVTAMLCSCGIGPSKKNEWEFPLVEASQQSTVTKAVPHSSEVRTDPFRSPDVTRSLPNSAPAPAPAPAHNLSSEIEDYDDIEDLDDDLGADDDMIEEV